MEREQTELRPPELAEKRRETMADGRRYIIFYTFGGEQKDADRIASRDEVGEGTDVRT